MATIHLLSNDAALSVNETRELEVILGEQKYDGFMVYVNAQLFCYINSCPHMGATLNWNPNQFLDSNQEFIQCSLHGALFEKHTGLCVLGPCVGAKLIALEVENRNGDWYLIDKRVSSVKT